jgi:hypothetical protein
MPYENLTCPPENRSRRRLRLELDHQKGERDGAGEEIIGKLREADVLLGQGRKVAEVVKALGVSEVTYPRPRARQSRLRYPPPRLAQRPRPCFTKRRPGPTSGGRSLKHAGADRVSLDSIGAPRKRPVWKEQVRW